MNVATLQSWNKETWFSATSLFQIMSFQNKNEPCICGRTQIDYKWTFLVCKVSKILKSSLGEKHFFNSSSVFTTSLLAEPSNLGRANNMFLTLLIGLPSIWKMCCHLECAHHLIPLYNIFLLSATNKKWCFCFWLFFSKSPCDISPFWSHGYFCWPL